MVKQFNLPIRIVGGETVRAADGLALSSRNQYLDAAQRAEAPQLQLELRKIQTFLLAGSREFNALQTRASDNLQARGWVVDYISIRERETLAPAASGVADWVVVAAARLGSTRLLDNIEVCDIE